MGRTLKRVPLDFDWPLGKVWGGYLNPHYRWCTDCSACAGSGLTTEAKRISDQWYGRADFDPVAYGATPLTIDHPALVAQATLQCERTPSYYGSGPEAVQREAGRLLGFWKDQLLGFWKDQLLGFWKDQWCHHLIQADVDALVAADRLYDFTRRPRTEEQAEALKKDGGYWMKEQNGYTPTADEVNAWSLGGMAHDAINASVCLRARCDREGVTLYCSACNGYAEAWASEQAKADYESWKPEEPPAGDGFQLWETTSEGSPSSPVFATIEELCAWCAGNATTFGSFKASADEWRKMLDADFVCHQEGNMVFL